MKNKITENYNLANFRIKVLFFVLDMFSVVFAAEIALVLRFDLSPSSVPDDISDRMWKVLPIILAIGFVTYAIFGLYRTVWRYAGITELANIIFAGTIISLAVFYITFFDPSKRMPRAFYALFCAALIGETVFTRFFARFFLWFRRTHQKTQDDEKPERVMIVGAGEACHILMKEIQTSGHLNYDVKCLIDDDKYKNGMQVRGVKVIGNRNNIVKAARDYSIDTIIIAINFKSAKEKKLIVDICNETGCKIKLLPPVYQTINGELNISKLRNVEIEDLLSREEVVVDTDSVAGYLKGKRVLVTGGGGSIGSELCRQIATQNPSALIIFDIYENNAYEIQQELRRNYPGLNLIVLIGSVRNKRRVDQVFDNYSPDIVYHAAAHKHVPLMEDSPNEAIKNNVFGTYNVAMAAHKHSCEKMILISTDKAVNPTNVMGATKRICEMIIQSFARESKTVYAAVRFGNVLGSNGSVIPLFKKQIEAGGPVTVTDPNIIRYFMTISEAVTLVLQAGAYAKDGEIFVLDMGEPVKIYDLAKNMIKLSGLTLGEDIEIVFSGLRPGEKLYEEMLMKEEGLKETDNNLIFIGKPIDIDQEKFAAGLKKLWLNRNDDSCDMRSIISEVVPTYTYKKK